MSVPSLGERVHMILSDLDCECTVEALLGDLYVTGADQIVAAYPNLA